MAARRRNGRAKAKSKRMKKDRARPEPLKHQLLHTTFVEKDKKVKRCSISPGGRHIIIQYYNDPEMSLWDIAKLRKIASLTGHQGSIHNCRFSETGDMVASASADKTIKLWSIPEAEVIKTLEHKDGVRDCALSPEGEFILSISETFIVTLWEIFSGKPVRTLNFPAFSKTYGRPYNFELSDEDEHEENEDDVGDMGFLMGCALSANGKMALILSSQYGLMMWTKWGVSICGSRPLYYYNWKELSNGKIWLPLEDFPCISSQDEEALKEELPMSSIHIWNLPHIMQGSVYAYHVIQSCMLSSDGKFALGYHRDENRLKLWRAKRSSPTQISDLSALSCVDRSLELRYAMSSKATIIPVWTDTDLSIWIKEEFYCRKILGLLERDTPWNITMLHQKVMEAILDR